MTNIQQPAEVKPTFKWVFHTASRTIAFGFGSGLSPVAPGTAGTLWAWAAFLVGEYFLSTVDFLWIIGGGILLGCWICGQVSEELGKKDFGGIVWDEIVAFWLILWLWMPVGLWGQFVAFVLFRFFDAVKPGPVGWADRHFHGLGWRGGWGIMLDDLVAAFCTLLCISLWQATR